MEASCVGFPYATSEIRVSALGNLFPLRQYTVRKAESSKVTDLSDSVLMQQVRDGDLRKLAVLFERHHRALFHFFLRCTGNRELGEDLVQEVYFRILRYRHTYDPKYSFTAWMYQIARNAQMDHFQKAVDQGSEDDKSLRRDAALAGVVHLGPNRPLDRFVQVGILKHNEGVASAKLHRRFLEVMSSPRPPSNTLSGFHAACQRAALYP